MDSLLVNVDNIELNLEDMELVELRHIEFNNVHRIRIFDNIVRIVFLNGKEKEFELGKRDYLSVVIDK